MSDHDPERPGAAEEPVQSDAEVREGGYRVVLPSFEGPLDLLLHLIQKHELDILNIPIGFVAQKYVEYLAVMEELSIDVASEYLVMAATLAYIKSKSLLPPDPSAAEDEAAEEEEEDPRAELIRRLLEYQKYKQAAEDLGGRSVLGRDVFPRGIALEQSTAQAPLMPLSLFKLVDAFEDVLKRAQRVQEHQVDFERISISDRIGSINELLRERGVLRFEELFAGDTSRAEMIVTFLALLEMTKLRMIFLQQDDPLGPITVELRVLEEDEEDFSWTSEVEERKSDAEPDDLAMVIDEPDVPLSPQDAELQEAQLQDAEWQEREPERQGEDDDEGASRTLGPSEPPRAEAELEPETADELPDDGASQRGE